MTSAPCPETRLLPVAGSHRVAARLWDLLTGRRIRLLLILGLFFAEAATALVFPLVIGRLVDAVVAQDGAATPAGLWIALAALSASALAAGLLAWSSALALARLAETVIAELREHYVTRALSLPRSVVERAGTGDIVTRASDDIAQISRALPEVLPRLCVSAFTIALVTVGLAVLDVRYLLGFALIVPAYVFTVRWYLRLAPGVYARERTAQSVRGQQILGTVQTLPTVRAHRLEDRQTGLIQDATWQTVRWAMRTRIVQNRLFGRLNAIEAAGLIAVLAIGLWSASRGEATAGAVTAAALLFLRTVTPIEALLFVLDDFQSALAALGRVIGIETTDIDGGHHPEQASDPATTSPNDRLLEFDDVDFSYRSGHAALTGVDLILHDREQIAVVGATGSGKSTLSALAAGVYAPDRGRLRHGVPEHRIATITQETHVFTGTVRENLILARPETEDQALWEALDRVGAQTFVAALPGGLDTPVGHGGHALTVAQVQHLALARLVLADPALAILDEATAEADTADAQLLDRAVEAAVDGRAALIVAHRLSQAARADRIIVLDAGRIIEHGTHHELLAADGSYAALWAAWSSPGHGRGRSTADDE